jgi:hypothetical protein
MSTISLIPVYSVIVRLRIAPPLWWVRLTRYEYWPWQLVYLPLWPVWLYCAIRARSLAYFTAVNPGWQHGGFYGVGKEDILARIPDAYKPRTVRIPTGTALDRSLMPADFPLIAKPNVGERGKGVARLNNMADWTNYHQQAESDYLLQPFVDYPLEITVLYSRSPEETRGIVSSVTLKEFLYVVGDGVRTVGALAERNTRARFQLDRLRVAKQAVWEQVLPTGQRLELENIGNHCHGTRFVAANYLIDSQLTAVFNNISRSIEGFQYGRFDLRVRSLDDLYAGQCIQILEINGVNADPAHIFDNSYGLLRAWRDIAWHWGRLADISISNQRNGQRPAAFREIWRAYYDRNMA